jgi:hypothetical protein
MSCCRGRATKFPTSYPAQVSAYCVSCREPLHDRLKMAIGAVSPGLVAGTHRRVFELECSCGWPNKVAVTFTKK